PRTAHDPPAGPTAAVLLSPGAVRLRDAPPRDAAKLLAHATRLAPSCPVVNWQIGTALLASGGDAALGARALAKAVEPNGLPRFRGEPNQLWAQTMPAGSWVGGLARRVGYRCPLTLDDVSA